MITKYSPRTMILIGLLLSLVTLASAAPKCDDLVKQPFNVGNGTTKKRCKDWINKCGKSPEIRKNCEKTCGLCAPKCDDLVKKPFNIGNDTTKKRCKDWIDRCGNSSEIRENCEKTCGLCCDGKGTSCCNVKGAFKFGKTEKRCIVANKKQSYCETKEFIKNCPLACGLCTKPPQTNLPTASPNTSPSSAPSMYPTPETCILSGTLAFPAIESNPPKGYHRDDLTVIMKGEEEACGQDNQWPSWGCLHMGNAYIQNWGQQPYSSEETATIDDARGNSYRFKIEHKFEIYETYYDFDYNMVGELSIAINENVVDIFSHPKNGKVDTHNKDGSVNAAYEGIIFVDVTCTSQCKCTTESVVPSCPIRAEIKFPSVDDAPYYGYHNDFLSVKSETEEGSCSPYETSTIWCTHEGDALIENFPGDDDYYSGSYTESVVIPDAAGRKFEFKIEHYYTIYETYYSSDHMMPGEVTIYVDGKAKGSYSHEINQEVDTHFEDGSVNPEYNGEFYLDLKCDDLCECKITRRENPICKIQATMAFPGQDDAPFKGYHSDSISVEKIGEAKKCAADNMETEWGCKHDGGIAYISNWNAADGVKAIRNDSWKFNTKEKKLKEDKEWKEKNKKNKKNNGEFSSDTESVLINGFGNYRFVIEHNFDDLENKEEYEQDHRMVGSMTLSINDREMGIFSHPVTKKKNTHRKDGSINPQYQGTSYIDVRCNSNCECGVRQIQPKCEINAVLSFDEFDADYGFRSNYLRVTQDEKLQVCSRQNTMTAWGCIHKGEARIHDFIDDEYYDDINESETAHIANALKGKFIFEVQHYYSYYDKYYKDDHKNRAELAITINGELKGTFKNKDQDLSYNEDGTVNPDYKGEMSVRVECSDECDCMVNTIEMISKLQ